jgi:hypothetical protein
LPELQDKLAMDALGRLLFPRLRSRARKKKMRALGWALLLGVAASGMLGYMILRLNRPGPAPPISAPPLDEIAPPGSR